MNLGSRIWDNLQSYWQSFLESLPAILGGLTIIILGIVVSRWLAQIFRRRVMKQMADPLLSGFISKILRFILILLALLWAFNVMGLSGVAGGLLAGAGVGALIIGLAFQDIGSNFLAGIILAFNRPFSIGDTIQVASTTGNVKGLNLRNTHVKTFDGKDVFIPNTNIIREEVINFTRDGLLRLDFVIGIDYDVDIAKAQQVIYQRVYDHPRILKSESYKPIVQIEEFATSTVNLRTYFWLETFDYKRSPMEIRGDIMGQVLRAMIENKIALPADIVELKHYKGKGFPIRMVPPESKT